MVIVKLAFKKKWVWDWMLLTCLMISGFIITFSFYHQYIEKIKPCYICKWQRFIYLSIFFLSPFGLMQRFNVITRNVVAILFFAEFSLATYHVFVQMGWLADRCVIPRNIEDIDDYMMMLVKPQIACATIGWQLFGLSASIYSAFFSAISCISLNITNILKLRSNNNVQASKKHSNKKKLGQCDS